MYDDLSKAYDLFVDWDARLAYEMPFIEGRLREVEAARVLDTACGTGMHALELARRGYNVVGTDSSVRMIERARSNAAEAVLDVHFDVAGFGGTWSTVGGGFDAVLCLGNSLPHVLTAQDLDAAVADFAACLRPGGRMLIQNRNFDAVLAGRDRWMEPQSRRVDDADWLFVRFYDFQSDGLLGFNILTLYRPQPGGEWAQQPAMTRLRPWGERDICEALGKAGFTEITAWGDMKGSSFDPLASPNLIVLAHRKTGV